MWGQGSPRALLVGVEVNVASLAVCFEVSQRWEIELPSDTAVRLLGISPKDFMSSCRGTSLCTWMDLNGDLKILTDLTLKTVGLWLLIGLSPSKKPLTVIVRSMFRFFGQVGGYWDKSCSTVTQLKEGLNRILCLIPYNVISQSVWECIMPEWLEAIRTEVPDNQLKEFREVLRWVSSLTKSLIVALSDSHRACAVCRALCWSSYVVLWSDVKSSGKVPPEPELRRCEPIQKRFCSCGAVIYIIPFAYVFRSWDSFFY